MRFVLLVHGRESERLAKPPEWAEEVSAFLAQFEDELIVGSEHDWSEVLGPEAQAVVVGPGGERRNEHYNADGKPLHRMWAVRVENKDRALALAAQLAGELDTWVEVRECFTSAQRP